LRRIKRGVQFQGEGSTRGVSPVEPVCRLALLQLKVGSMTLESGGAVGRHGHGGSRVFTFGAGEGVHWDLLDKLVGVVGWGWVGGGWGGFWESAAGKIRIIKGTSLSDRQKGFLR